MPSQAAYEVELNAPGRLDKLLKEHLDLFPYRKRENIKQDQLNFMIETVPEQVKRLAATIGYFSPMSSVKVERNGETKVLLAVSAGAQAAVYSVAINITGPIVTQHPQQAARIRQNWALKAGLRFLALGLDHLLVDHHSDVCRLIPLTARRIHRQ